jgi:hypothetical protein
VRACDGRPPPLHLSQPVDHVVPMLSASDISNPWRTSESVRSLQVNLRQLNDQSDDVLMPPALGYSDRWRTSESARSRHVRTSHAFRRPHVLTPSALRHSSRHHTAEKESIKTRRTTPNTCCDCTQTSRVCYVREREGKNQVTRLNRTRLTASLHSKKKKTPKKGIRITSSHLSIVSFAALVHPSLIENMHGTTPHPLDPPPLPNALAMELAKALQPPHFLPSLELFHADRALLLSPLPIHTVLLGGDVRENAAGAVGHCARAGDRRWVRVRCW